MPPKEKRESTSRIHVDEEDDERTQVSKVITWVLRRGAAVAGVDMDDKGWVKIADLVKYDKLKDQTEQQLLQVIDQSNTKKARYQVSPDRTYIRAFGKEERKTINDQYTDPQAAAAVAQMGQMGGGYPGYWPQNPYSMMPYMMNPFMGMGWQQAAAARASGRHQGRIKSFNAEKGFGFIECGETQAMYGRDVFVHKSQVGDLPLGSWVTFVLEMNKNDMPQGKDLQPLGAPAQAFQAQGKGGKGGKGKGGKSKGKDGEKGKAKGEGKGKKGKDKKDEENKEIKDSEDKADEKKPADETAKAPEAMAEEPKA